MSLNQDLTGAKLLAALAAIGGGGAAARLAGPYYISASHYITTSPDGINRQSTNSIARNTTRPFTGTSRGLRVLSSSFFDTGAGAGLRTARIRYLTSLGARASVDVTLNGTTPVLLPSDASYVFEIIPLTYGSAGYATGTISISDGTLSYDGVMGVIENSYSQRPSAFTLDADVEHLVLRTTGMFSAQNGGYGIYRISSYPPGGGDQRIESDGLWGVPNSGNSLEQDIWLAAPADAARLYVLTLFVNSLPANPAWYNVALGAVAA